MNFCSKDLDHSQIIARDFNPIGLCDPWDNTYLHNWKPEELGIIALKLINVLMKQVKSQKRKPCQEFHKSVGEVNLYV